MACASHSCSAMLRISRADHEGLTVLRLEGRLSGPWVDELRRVLADCRERTLELDLSDVPFVDTIGTELLRRLLAEGVAFRGCSAYVLELLRESHPHGTT